MRGLQLLDWRAARRRSVPQLVRALGARHPELLERVTFPAALAIAQREGITVRVRALPPQQKAELVRLFNRHVFIHVNRRLTRDEQTVHVLHELCHFWRDDPGVACYHSDELTGGPSCEFADIFAWAVTSPARHFVPGLEPDAQLRLELDRAEVPAHSDAL